LHFSDYIVSHKFKVCKANEKVDRYLDLEIPISYEVDYIPKIVSLQELFFVKSYPCSNEGNIISVSYTLKVFVKLKDGTSSAKATTF
jgi:hypothetical protein